MLRQGDVINGTYKILSLIGRGGMSNVYMAINERANKTWAVKEIRRDGVQNYDVIRQGLRKETELLKRLHHPHLPAIVDVIEDRDSFLIVMDYIEGIPLSTALREQGAQAEKDVIRWAVELCDVLAYLHSRKPAVIYRDMKPSNIMRKPDGSVMLIDFGIAREFKQENQEDTVCLGTKGYAAPEQYGGFGQTDERTDIYCLGATLYHLVTGHSPADPPYEMVPIRRWNAELSSGLEAIIMKCTQPDPEDRFQSCETLGYALEHYQEMDLEYRRKRRRQLTGFLVACGCSVICLAGAAGSAAASVRIRDRSYEHFLLRARQETDRGKQFGYYLEAVDLDPTQGTAYCEVLERAMEDGVFSGEEQGWFRRMLNNQARLREHPEEYRKVCRMAAMAYFYYVDGDTKDGAIGWLGELREMDGLPESDRVRADLLFRIASYYRQLNTVNLTGDYQISYLDYWEDLCRLAQDNLTEKDNVMTALVTYREIVGQLCQHSKQFRDAGVIGAQVRDEMEHIRKALEEEVTPAIAEVPDGATRERWEAEKGKIGEMLEMIEREIVPTVFGD